MSFKIISILVVKNEVDIVGDVIKEASKWSDKIIVLDNHSNDGTWELINSLKNDNEKIIIWGQYHGKFYDQIRQRVFQDYKYLANNGDWWCRLDADEIYIDNPREFIKLIDKKIDHIESASFQFYLTERDYVENKTVTYKDLKWYSCNHSELRFFRHNDSLIWPQKSNWPINLVLKSRKKIRLKHYQYRDFLQVKKRINIRKNNSSDLELFGHERTTDDQWYLRRGFKKPLDEDFVRQRIVLSCDLKCSDNYVIPSKLKNIEDYWFGILIRKIKLFIIFYSFSYI